MDWNILQPSNRKSVYSFWMEVESLAKGKWCLQTVWYFESARREISYFPVAILNKQYQFNKNLFFMRLSTTITNYVEFFFTNFSFHVVDACSFRFSAIYHSKFLDFIFSMQHFAIFDFHILFDTWQFRIHPRSQSFSLCPGNEVGSLFEFFYIILSFEQENCVNIPEIWYRPLHMTGKLNSIHLKY